MRPTFSNAGGNRVALRSGSVRVEPTRRGGFRKIALTWDDTYQPR